MKLLLIYINLVSVFSLMTLSTFASEHKVEILCTIANVHTIKITSKETKCNGVFDNHARCLNQYFVRENKNERTIPQPRHEYLNKYSYSTLPSKYIDVIDALKLNIKRIKFLRTYSLSNNNNRFLQLFYDFKEMPFAAALIEDERIYNCQIKEG
jgi:hypothetical protein